MFVGRLNSLGSRRFDNEDHGGFGDWRQRRNPALKGGQGSKEVQEERRSCFVAITRARQYYGYVNGPSQFLGEMGM